jgi:hypothetical protein
VATTSSARSICTVRRSQPSKRSEIAQRKRASCRRWRGRSWGSKTPAARRYFFESVRAYTELASIRGVGLSLIGLAAAAAVDHRPDAAVRIAAAAEIYAGEESIVNVYGAAEDVIRTTEAGRRLTIAETLELARPGDPAPL